MPAGILRHARNGFAATVHILLLAFFFEISASAAPAVHEGSLVGVSSAIVYDMDQDAILFEQNADQPIPPASLTKIMSMFLARDFVKNGHANMNSPVKVSAGAASAGGSRMGLKAGEELPLNRLLLGMAVSSGNDASHAVAEYVGGSVGSFVKMMNLKAAQLGMTDSNFCNPHGLPAEGQHTTARDMLALARAYLKAYPDALDFHNTRTLTHRGYTSWNKNPLLGQYPGADGLKSGWIRASGYNLVFTATRGNRRLLAVILGAPDSGVRGAEACRLLDAGFMVCGNMAVSVAAALDSLPYDEDRIDPRKTAREAGLLKAKINGSRMAQNSITAKKKGRKAIQSAKGKNAAKKAVASRAAKKDRPKGGTRADKDLKNRKSAQAARKTQKGRARKS